LGAGAKDRISDMMTTMVNILDPDQRLAAIDIEAGFFKEGFQTLLFTLS